MVENFFSIYLIILYIIVFIISISFKKYQFSFLWFPAIYYLFKPFFGRLIIFLDSQTVLSSFDKFSLLSVSLFPITIIYFSIKYNFLKIFLEHRLSKLFLAFSFFYLIQIFNPSTSIVSGVLALKNIFFALFESRYL